jgi:hypothetical protein
MKKIFTLLLVTSLCFSVNAQFSDDFESYNAGDYLAESSTVWSTWSGSGEGTDEDVQVTSDMANGGSNSIYLASTDAAGGPQDLLLPFNTVFEQGNFAFEADYYIPAQSTGLYFNFQTTTTVTEGWTLNSYITFDQANTNVRLTGPGDETLLEVVDPFAPNSWFNLRIEADLTLNQWELFIDNVSQGTFANVDANGATYTQIASIDFYPVEGNMAYIDNVLIEVPNTLDASLTEITTPTSLAIPVNEYITGNIANLGNETITSMDITWTDGTDSYTDQLTGLNITTLDVYEFSHTDALVSNVIGSADITITVNNVNGGSDDDALNNEISTVINFTAPPASWNCEAEGCVDPTDGSGEFNSLTLCMINCTVGVDELKNLNTLLTPNPTSDNTTLSFSAENMEVIIEIKNIAGQVVSTRNYGLLNGQQKLTLNTASLPNGIYLIDMKVNGQSSVHKLVKQ